MPSRTSADAGVTLGRVGAQVGVYVVGADVGTGVGTRVGVYVVGAGDGSCDGASVGADVGRPGTTNVCESLEPNGLPLRISPPSSSRA